MSYEQGFYDEAFDADGDAQRWLRKFASQEIAFNADNVETNIETLWMHVPILKSIFMFPRLLRNAISVVQTFDPTGAILLVEI